MSYEARILSAVRSDACQSLEPDSLNESSDMGVSMSGKGKQMVEGSSI